MENKILNENNININKYKVGELFSVSAKKTCPKCGKPLTFYERYFTVDTWLYDRYPDLIYKGEKLCNSCSKEIWKYGPSEDVCKKDKSEIRESKEQLSADLGNWAFVILLLWFTGIITVLLSFVYVALIADRIFRLVRLGIELQMMDLILYALVFILGFAGGLTQIVVAWLLDKIKSSGNL